MLQRILNQVTGSAARGGRRSSSRGRGRGRATTGGRNAMIGTAVSRFLRSRR